MAKTYAELSREIEALKVQAEAVRQKEKAGVIERIRDAIVVYGLTADELGVGRKATATTAPKASGSPSKRADPAAVKAPKTKEVSLARYLDGSGNTWGGRGPQPNWLKAELANGRSLESFSSDKSAVAGKRTSQETAAGTRDEPKAKKVAQAEKAYKSVIKYRDDDGHTWSGRGPKPTWFTSALERGKTPDQLAV